MFEHLELKALHGRFKPVREPDEVMRFGSRRSPRNHPYFSAGMDKHVVTPANFHEHDALDSCRDFAWNLDFLAHNPQA